MITRLVQKHLVETIGLGKVIILYGPRQVGKTTLVKAIMSDFGQGTLYLNCDEPDIRAALTNKTSTELKSLVGDSQLVVIDEAQRVHNIGLTLKLMADNYPDIQILATGSSSFELSNSIKEPLTGRSREFLLLPFSMAELALDSSRLEAHRLLEERLLYGSYPEVLRAPLTAKGNTIQAIASSYLYRDILSYTQVKNPELLDRLLRALALQIGSEVSYNELGSMLGIDKETVASYIRLLERAFIIFRLGPFSRNLRKELGKLRKLYFYDLGIRNALINNFNGLDSRTDTGALWENFLMAERMKKNLNEQRLLNCYFWRTYDHKEIDLIEEQGGQLSGYEFKLKGQRYKPPSVFLETYEGSTIELITRDNYLDFVV